MLPDKDPCLVPDYARINISNEKQMVFWTSHLGVSEKQLKYAVEICGPILKEIKEYLGHQEA